MIFKSSARCPDRTRALALLCALLLTACAAPQTRQLLVTAPPALPQQALIESVPFFPQLGYYCGPAALAMAMNFYGRDVTQQSMVKAVYVPELEGSLQAEMLGATRREGMLAYVLRPQLPALLTEVAAGHPVIVLQNRGVSWYPSWHYAVAIGYDLKAEEIILHSGEIPYYRLPLSTFEHTWARSDYWALVVLPPGELPHEDEPLRALDAITALEGAGRIRAARAFYAAAVERWPDSLIARMGLGNTRYALGEVQAAMRAFLAAARAHPESAAAYNNLAVTLDELGCEEAARQAAHHAVGLDENEPEYAQTLLQISTDAAPVANGDCPTLHPLTVER